MLSDQLWLDLVFLHWRVEPSRVARWMPAGTRPDVYDGSTWVGLIGFEMRCAGLGPGVPVPWLGSFGEINVRLYSVDGDGRRGVVFRSLETDRAAVALATNLVRVRYRWAGVEVRRGPDHLGYRSRRWAPPGRGARTDFAVRTGTEVRDDDPLGVFLTARWGMHHQAFGRGVHVPNRHDAWPLRSAELLGCEDQLVAAAGLPGVTDRPPESVLWSPGVRTQFGRPERVEPVRSLEPVAGRGAPA